MQKKISVIIPVYNGVKYIARCIDSVLAQQNFDIEQLEILLLNDGSTDGSVDLLEQYQEKYSDIIKVVSHSNMGVAKTRNKGISLARGEYCIFIDQDDYIDLDYCKVLLAEIDGLKLDVVISGMKRPDENGKIITRDTYRDHYFSRFMCMSVWAKIHRTDFLRENKIELFDNAHGEDIVFSFEEAQNTKKIKCIEYCGYNWFYNTQSVSNTSQRGLGEKNLKSILTTQKRLIELDHYKDNANLYFITLMTAYYIFFAGRKTAAGDFMNAVNVLMNNLKKHYPHYDKNPYIWRSPKGALPIFSIGVKAFVILYKLKLLGFYAKIYCKDTPK